MPQLTMQPINYATHDNDEQFLQITCGFHSSTQNLYNVNPTEKDFNCIRFIKPSNFSRIKSVIIK